MKPDTLVAGLLVATALRASEYYRPAKQRLFNPVFAQRFLPPLVRLLLLPGIRHVLTGVMARAAIGGMGMLLCRTRYIDDAMRDALAAGIDQVVNLGAGLDTRVFRIPGTEHIRTFEMDRPNMMSWKRHRLEAVLGEVPTYLTLVSIDFDTQSLEEELGKAGYQRRGQTFFIWEGVTQYISLQAVDRTLRFVGEEAGPGSRMAFTYIDTAIVNGTQASGVDEYLMRRAARGGLPWVSGLEPHNIEAYLAERGLELIEQCDADCYRARYLEPARRQMTVYEGEIMVLAQVVGHGVQS